MIKFLLVFTLLTSQAWASQESSAIKEVIENYFQGYQQADTSLIKKAFHPETKLLSVENEKLDITEMKDWLLSLEDRRLRGDIRTGKLKIESIDVTHQSAIVKLKIQFPKFYFIDYLSLLKIDHQWIIVGKIYHFQER